MSGHNLGDRTEALANLAPIRDAAPSPADAASGSSVDLDSVVDVFIDADGDARSDKEVDRVAALVLGNDERWIAGLQRVLDAAREGREVLVIVQPDLVAAVKEFVAHYSSPSVGAPSGAVCDNSNPTDGEPPSGAAANLHAAAPDSP